MTTQPSDLHEGFPSRFQEFLASENLNSNSLATALGESNPLKYRRWIDGEATPNSKNLAQIAIKYNLDVNWLLLGVGAMKRGDVPATVSTQVPVSSLPGSTAINERLQADLKAKEEMIAKLLEQNAQQASRIDKLQDKVLEQADKMMTLAMGFPLLDSHSPASDMIPAQDKKPMGFDVPSRRRPSAAQSEENFVEIAGTRVPCDPHGTDQVIGAHYRAAVFE